MCIQFKSEKNASNVVFKTFFLLCKSLLRFGSNMWLLQLGDGLITWCPLYSYFYGFNLEASYKAEVLTQYEVGKCENLNVFRLLNKPIFVEGKLKPLMLAVYWFLYTIHPFTLIIRTAIRIKFSSGILSQ